jgi:NADP-dependent aldehyde dehydrogenase
MSLTGQLFIGADRVAARDTFRAADPSTGSQLDPAFACATSHDVDRACALASACFDAYRETSLEDRAAFLERIAEEIMNAGDALIERAEAETGLPRARLEGERGRTAGQLRLFAGVVRNGDWIGARIDSALPERAPLPRPDLRQRKIPLGPVVVFGASNFPLAFSVAGGDTASALAAGCPVIVKGHSAHPGTGELVAGAVAAAVKACRMPEGVFSLLNGKRDVGTALVADPRVKAVGFTGSRAGGLALANVAAQRPEPIPVYAEMSSINPVILLPAAVEARAEETARGFAASLTMGAGQFCTNPGLVIVLDCPALDTFMKTAASALSDAVAQVMLTEGICSAYEAGVRRLSAHPKVEALTHGREKSGVNQGRAALFSVSAEDYLADESLNEEVFGAASLVVRCASEAQLMKVLESLEGQLTATLHMESGDERLAGRLLPLLERKAGRILVNGWPTGVEVCHAMVHGGPFPATSDARATSVGTLAIERFLRPVCYQNFSDELLPAALKSANPASLRRLVDGAWR